MASKVAVLAVLLVVAGAAPVEWSAPREVATGGGRRGPWAMNESDYRYVDDPTVALDRRGRAAVAWVEQTAKDVFFLTFEPDGRAVRSSPRNVSRSPATFSWLPRLVIDPDRGTIVLCWQEIIFSGGSHGGDIVCARSIDGGDRFANPINLTKSRAGEGKGRLTRDDWHNGSFDAAWGTRGDLHVAWTEYEGRLWTRRSLDGGATFEEALVVAGDFERPARGPTLVVHGGDVHLAWTIGEDPSADIHISRSPNRGQRFEPPHAVRPGDGHSDAPKLAVTGEGALHLVYAESPSGRGGRYRIRHTRSDDAGTTFTPPVDVAAPETTQAASLGFPHVDEGPDRRLYVVWESVRTAGQRPDGLGFAVSRDGGRTFSAPAEVPGTTAPVEGHNGGLQGLLMRKLDVDDAGRLAVVHSTFREGVGSRVLLVMGRDR